MPSKNYYQYYCSRCEKRTSSPYAKRANARLCSECVPDMDMIPDTPKNLAPIIKSEYRPRRSAAKRAREAAALAAKSSAAKKGKPATSAGKAATPAKKPATQPAKPVATKKAKAVGSKRTAKGAVEPVAPTNALPVAPSAVIAPQTASTPVKPATIPPAISPDAAALDARIAEAREAMNRLATDLSAKRIELAALRDHRRALGPLPRTPRDPDAPRRPTLLDAAAQVLADAAEPMQAKAIWQAIVERGLWQSPNGGKTPFATLAAAIMRDVDAKGTTSRFVKAGRGLFAVNSAVDA